jgi:hypothetical protein
VLIQNAVKEIGGVIDINIMEAAFGDGSTFVEASRNGAPAVSRAVAGNIRFKAVAQVTLMTDIGASCPFRRPAQTAKPDPSRTFQAQIFSQIADLQRNSPL